MTDSSNISIHFAFPDGVLRYACGECDQRCCKLGGLVVFPAERDRILKMHPALELVSPASGGNIAVFSTPRSGCWFLEEDRCRLLTSDERQMNHVHTPPRPATCTLFPFNLFGVLGDYLVVAPNAVCPLEIAPGHGVRHEDLVAQLGVLGAAGAPPELQRPADPADSIVLERVVRDACQATLEDPMPFSLLAFCDAAGRAFASAGIEGLQALDLSILPGRATELRAESDALATLLAIPPPSEAAYARTAPLLAAWTPSLRIFGFPDLPLEQLAQAQLVLTLYAAHWVDLNPERKVLPQALMQLVSSLGPSIAVLSAGGHDAVRVALEEVAATPLERATRLRRLATVAISGEMT